ncbi:MAG: ATP-binding protein [Candidatus Wallbacteria bacterium]|nr:ATP-binding protein [Candidatus Wallbacteria bacterium]
MFKRPVFSEFLKRCRAKRNFIQVLSGPRQTGKTTLVRQMMQEISVPVHYASADEPLLKDRAWLTQQWETARALCRNREGLVVLDEIQKIQDWSETVKRLWDEDTASGSGLRAVILGSSPLLVRKGLSDSLAGRFETIPVTHWSFPEMKAAFGWDLLKYIYYGGYPGSAALIEDHERWRHYILDSLIETTVSRDILLMNRVEKPVLLRRLFELGCTYSGQVLSYQKMLGQLQDAGNTTTLAHYLELLDSAGLLTGLQKFYGDAARTRSSSPKFMVYNTALLSALSSHSYEAAVGQPEIFGRLVESAVGATLLNGAKGKRLEVYYWAGGNREVDFVLRSGKTVTAIEVKSGRKKTSLQGLEQFNGKFRVDHTLLVGTGGIPLETFLASPVEEWVTSIQ